MRLVSDGMAGEIHEKDVRIAEGLHDLELPKDPAGAALTFYTDAEQRRHGLQRAVRHRLSRPAL